MTYTLTDYIAALSACAQTVSFEDTLELIDGLCDFTPTAFTNGNVRNAAGENSGSCKVFSFAKLHGLTDEQTLHMFAQHYQNVLDNPEGDNHGNIRAFMQTGLTGVTIDGPALTSKP